MAEKRGRTKTEAVTTVAEGVEPVGDADLAAALPESLTIDVELPAPVHERPADEQAVALLDSGVDPAIVGAVVGTVETGTTVIELAHDELHAVVTTPPTGDDPDADVEIPPLPQTDGVYSRRDMLDGVHQGPESAAMLTADRLIEPRRRNRTAPEGRWPAFVYAVTFHLVNIGDSRRVRERKELDAKIATAFEGGARFVPVLTRKGGVGKTTITTLLGMALASVRDDRVIAIDANPDRGTLSERVARQTRATVRDVVNRAPSIQGFTDFSTLVSRDETRLDILASDTDPMLSEAFDENDYNVVADLAARYYSIVLTDCGTGIVHSVMRATLQRADALVIVSGGSVDEARLASETLTWLEANGYGELVREAIVAINTATQGTNLVKLEEIEAHFASRVRQIVRIPYDEQLAAGSVISWRDLRPLTRQAARELAALVAQGMPVRRGV
ncbi:MinD/ParA family ATP-binding protein [Microcella humidisoli]|uniref:MinD/ParA family protein n=1 Tax=Microcella humidisoli TaxID=2963406 RepID=A0ABY5FVB5_9MICO|nr:MinD/ParA family protein [Microcella humidisoli]UTT62188.1 MinD/ParA family protein [Microcella humidisoli]